MDREVKVKQKITPDLTVFVNAETGETMIGEFGDGVSISVVKTTDQTVLISDNFTILNTDAIDELLKMINDIDFARFIIMSMDIKTPMSVLFNGSQPHTNKTLQERLRIKSSSKYLSYISRMIAVGVLVRIKGMVNGHSRNIYLINPFICRKRKTFDNKVLALFPKFKGSRVKKIHS